MIKHSLNRFVGLFAVTASMVSAAGAWAGDSSKGVRVLTCQDPFGSSVVVTLDREVEHFMPIATDGTVVAHAEIELKVRGKTQSFRDVAVIKENMAFGGELRMVFARPSEGYEETGWLRLSPAFKKKFFGGYQYLGKYTGGVYLPQLKGESLNWFQSSNISCTTE